MLKCFRENYGFRFREWLENYRDLHGELFIDEIKLKWSA